MRDIGKIIFLLHLLIVGILCAPSCDEQPLKNSEMEPERSSPSIIFPSLTPDVRPPPTPDVISLTGKRYRYQQHMTALKEALSKGPEEAVKALEALHREDPQAQEVLRNLAAAYNNLGVKAKDKEAFTKAMGAYRDLLSRDPKDQKAAQALLNVCRNAQDRTCERDALERLLTIQPDDKAIEEGLQKVEEALKRVGEEVD